MKLKSYLRGIGIGVAATALILHFSGGGNNTEMSDAQIRARAAELGMVERMTLAESGGEKPTAPPRENVEPTTEVTEVPLETPAETDAATTPEAASADPTETPEVPVSPVPTSEETAATVTPTPEPTATPTPEPTATPTTAPTATPTPEPTATPTPEPTATPTATPKPTATPTPEPTAKPTATPAPTMAPTATPAPTAANAKPGYAINTADTTITVRSGDGSQTVARRMAEAGVVASAKELDDYLCAHGYDRKICTGAHVIPAGASFEEIGKIITSK